MRRTMAAVAALVVFCAVAWMAGGCGGSGTEARAQQVLNQSTSATTALKSVKEKGSNGMKSQDSSIPDVQVTYTSEMDLTDPARPTAHTMIKQGDTTINAYASGGYVYTETGSGKWQKVKAEGTSALAPKDLKEIAAGARNVRLLAGNGNQYEVAFEVGEQALKDSDLLGGADRDTEVGKQTAEALKDLKMSAVYSIAKDTMLIERVHLDMKMPSVAESGQTTGEVTVNLSGFNQPVSIVLPEAAKSATSK